MPDYIVYKHVCPNGKVYVGITSQRDPNRRWQNGVGYKSQRLFYRAIEKYGWEKIEHIVISSGLTKEAAEEMEIDLIKKYKSNDHSCGYNVDNGGNACGSHSEETKRKIGDAQRGAKNHQFGKPSWNRGRKSTPEAIEKNRISHLGQSAPNKGKKMTEEQKRKLRSIKKSPEWCRNISKAKSREVMCVDTGVVYQSTKAAGEALGINRGSIANVCNGLRKKAGGLQWRYT